LPRDYSLYIDDILESIEKIYRYIDDYDLEAFSKDESPGYGMGKDCRP
jgi:uncharacterized protein with HEPN domain